MSTSFNMFKTAGSFHDLYEALKYNLTERSSLEITNSNFRKSAINLYEKDERNEDNNDEDYKIAFETYINDYGMVSPLVVLLLKSPKYRYGIIFAESYLFDRSYFEELPLFCDLLDIKIDSLEIAKRIPKITLIHLLSTVPQIFIIDFDVIAKLLYECIEFFITENEDLLINTSISLLGRFEYCIDEFLSFEEKFSEEYDLSIIEILWEYNIVSFNKEDIIDTIKTKDLNLPVSNYSNMKKKTKLLETYHFNTPNSYDMSDLLFEVIKQFNISDSDTCFKLGNFSNYSIGTTRGWFVKLEINKLLYPIKEKFENPSVKSKYESLSQRKISKPQDEPSKYECIDDEEESIYSSEDDEDGTQFEYDEEVVKSFINRIPNYLVDAFVKVLDLFNSESKYKLIVHLNELDDEKLEERIKAINNINHDSNEMHMFMSLYDEVKQSLLKFPLSPFFPPFGYKRPIN